MLDILRRWLIGDMGTPGEYQYQAIHWYAVAAVMLAVTAVVVLGVWKRTDSRGKRQLLIGICWFQLGFEILWRLVYLLVKHDSILCWWPVYPCNLGGVLIPVIGLLNWRRGKQIFYLFGFVGGMLTFALPQGIFSTDVMVFPVLKSVLQHTGLLLIPILEYTTGTFRPKLGDLGWELAGVAIHAVNSEGIARLLGQMGDYMFLRSDLPFVIPGVPQIITLGVVALTVLTGLSFLSDIPGSVQQLQRMTPGKRKELDMGRKW